MEISVRAATLDDAPAMAVVNLTSWEAAYRGIVADAFLDNADLRARTARWQELLAAGANSILVAEVAGVVAGYCSLILPARDADLDDLTGEVGAIYVSPEAFRGGIGSAMLEASLALMRDRGFHDVSLWVLTQNARARAFYARHGFRFDGTEQWIDALEAEEMRLRRPL